MSYLTKIESLSQLKDLIKRAEMGTLKIHEYVVQHEKVGTNFTVTKDSFLDSANDHQFHSAFWDNVVYSTISHNVIFRG